MTGFIVCLLLSCYGILHSYECRPHLSHINHCFDDEGIYAAPQETNSLTVEIVIGRLKVQITQRLHKATGRTNIAGNLHIPAAALSDCPPGALGRRLVQLLTPVAEAIMFQLQRACAEGIRRYISSTGRNVITVNAGYNLRLLCIHQLGAGSRLQTASLKHGSHAAVKNLYHINLPLSYVQGKITQLLFYYEKEFCQMWYNLQKTKLRRQS